MHSFHHIKALLELNPAPCVKLFPPLSAKQAAYRPPGLRGQPYTYKLVSSKSDSPRHMCLTEGNDYVQHEEEPAQSVGRSPGNQAPEKLSKSAQKNRRKKETRQKAKEDVSYVG